MYKILMVGMSPVLAGTETFIMNYYRNIDKSKIQIDFIKRTNESLIFQDEILSNGSKIYYIPKKSSNPIQYYRIINSFFKKIAKDYDAIWYNAMGIPNIDFLRYAKKYGIKDRIIHSHSTMWKGNYLKYLLHLKHKSDIENIATKFFACSKLAAQYMFHNRILPKSKIIQNAIEPKKFSFSLEKRVELLTDLKSKLGWNNCKIIGCVGRLDIQKNHPFLIDRFYEAYKKNNNLRLIIVGSVSGKNSTNDIIKEKLNQYNLSDKIYLAGSHFDMKKWLSAFDLFILPSIFEGLPLSAVEAQANGLPVLLSDSITKEVKILNNVSFVSLQEPSEVWVEKILSMVNLDRESDKLISKLFKEKNFDILYQTKEVEKLLLKGE